MLLKNLTLTEFLLYLQELVYCCDLKTQQLSWIGPLNHLFQQQPPPSTLSQWQELLQPADILTQNNYLSKDQGEVEWEYCLKKGESDEIWLQERGKIDLERGCYIAHLRFIERFKQQQQTLEKLAYCDSLTGFFNKHRFKEILTQRLQQQTAGIYLAFAINNLDILNIAYGFAVTDKIIHESVERLRQWLQPNDIIGRISGNCYGLIIDHQALKGMEDISLALRDVFRSVLFETTVGPLQVTVSVGGVKFPEQSNVAADIITKADSALAQAKRHGINCFKPYSISLPQQQQQQKDISVTTAVHKALLENRLRICYQATYNNLKTIGFYEALIRMVDPEGQIIAAAQFMPIAEQFGMANTLDHWVMETVVKEILAYPDLCIALNISGYTVNNEEWLQAFKMALKPNPKSAERLIIEITETAAIDNLEQSVEFVQALKKLGCRISLDDFGAGYTSFLHLKCLPLDIVKIDAAYIKDLDKNPYNLNFVTSLLSLTKPRGIQTVAEGIETSTVYEMLQPLNIDYYQGYFLAKPTLKKPWAKSE